MACGLQMPLLVTYLPEPPHALFVLASTSYGEALKEERLQKAQSRTNVPTATLIFSAIFS